MILSQVGERNWWSPQPCQLAAGSRRGWVVRQWGRSALVRSHNLPSPAAMAVPNTARWDEAGGEDMVPMSSALTPGHADGWSTPSPCWDHPGRGAVPEPSSTLLLPAAGMLPCPIYGEWPHTLSPTKAKAPWPGCCWGDLGVGVGDLVVPLVTYNLLPCFQALQELAAQHPSIKLVQLGMEQSPSLHPTSLLALRSLQGRDREQLSWAASLCTGSQAALVLPGGEGAVHIWAGFPLQAELPTGRKQSNWLQRQAEVGLDTSAEQVSWERHDLCSQRC